MPRGQQRPGVRRIGASVLGVHDRYELQPRYLRAVYAVGWRHGRDRWRLGCGWRHWDRRGLRGRWRYGDGRRLGGRRWHCDRRRLRGRRRLGDRRRLSGRRWLCDWRRYRDRRRICSGWRFGGRRRICSGWRNRDGWWHRFFGLRGHALAVLQHLRRHRGVARELRELRSRLRQRRSLHQRFVRPAADELHDGSVRCRLLLRSHLASVRGRLPPLHRLPDGSDVHLRHDVRVPGRTTRVRATLREQHRHDLVRRRGVHGVSDAGEREPDV